MLRLPAFLSGFSSRADGSAGVRFSTLELTAQDYGMLQSMLNKQGWLVFKEDEVQMDDIPTEAVEDKSKTPSKRLRAALFVLYKQRGETQDFEVWYRGQVEKIIDYVKAKLD